MRYTSRDLVRTPILTGKEAGENIQGWVVSTHHFSCLRNNNFLEIMYNQYLNRMCTLHTPLAYAASPRNVPATRRDFAP
jgi:hypothetical protein